MVKHKFEIHVFTIMRRSVNWKSETMRGEQTGKQTDLVSHVHRKVNTSTVRYRSGLEGTRDLSHSLAVDNDVVHIERDLEDRRFRPVFLV
jgi:hypothetical protein